MPTLEERLAALEHTLSTVMQQFQRQLAEQRREYHQRFDALEKALVHQFNALNASINARFEAHDIRFTRVEQRLEQQAVDFRWKFDEMSHYAVETRGIVAMQQKDIREMKEDIKEVKGRLDTLENKVDSLENKVDSLENKMDRRFGKVDEQFDKMDLRFDQIIALIKNQNN